MKHAQVLLSLGCVLLAGCASNDPRLLGSWRSDAGRSMAWNREHAHLAANQESMLGQMFGHMTITYSSGGKGSVAMEPYTLALGANTHAMHGFTNSVDFRIIRRKEDRVVVRTTSGLMSNNVSTVYFEGPDTYWVLLNETAPATSAREYFRRLK